MLEPVVVSNRYLYIRGYDKTVVVEAEDMSSSNPLVFSTFHNSICKHII